MTAKVVVGLCVHVFFVQCVFSHCIDVYTPGCFGYDRFAAYDFWGAKGLFCNKIHGSAIDYSPSSSGGLLVTSTSSNSPTGISVISDNTYEGVVAISGEVPFVGTSGLEGSVPTIGAGVVHHVCGNVMLNEPISFGVCGSTVLSKAIETAGCGCFH